MALALRTSLPTIRPSGELIDRLSQSHTRIEAAFLEGGATLVSVMELVTGLVGTLDRVTGALDSETTSATIDGLHRTIGELARLPDLMAGRQLSFDEISDLCAASKGYVADMHETFRYLKVFAITVKITGAGLAEFADFADEIRDRIHSGAKEIERFASELAVMQGELSSARAFSSSVLSDFQTAIPEIVANLTENATRLIAQHAAMAKRASEVRAVAGAVQTKIATALSSLQIGDITRQRIEHVQASFKHLDAFLESPAGLGLSTDERDGITACVLHLAHAQLGETLRDFRAQCAKIFTTISSFTADASRILDLRSELAGYRDEPEQDILKIIARDIGHACDLAARVEGRSREATALVASVTDAVQALITAIEMIRSIKIDIHYMALNSNLRCSRLGDAGRSVNVVSGELRTFAGRLEEPADKVVEGMRRIEGAAGSLSSEGGGAIAEIATPLGNALQAITSVSASMDESLDAFNAEGDAVFGRIAAAVGALDFESSLGAVLEACVDIAAEMASAIGDPRPALAAAPLSEAIYRTYTMAQEREIHQSVFPMDGITPASEPRTASEMSDEDLFEDALF
jgi:methyl-accepting chemotaxis protein